MFSVRQSFPWISNQKLITTIILLAIPIVMYFHAQPHIEMAILGFACSTILLHCSVRRGYFFALSPMTWIILSFFLTTVIGSTLMWYGISYRFGGSGDILPGILKVQTYGIEALISLFIGYSILNFKTKRNLCLSKKNKNFLSAILLSSLIYTFVLLILSTLVFELDRFSQDKPAAAFHAINAFQKLSYLWFFLIPIIKNKSKILKLLITFAAILFWGISATSGSRSALIFPFIYYFVGLYFFSSTSFKIEKLAKWLLLFPLLAFPLAEYRDSNYFRSLKPYEIIKRASGFFDKEKYQENEWDWHGKIQLVGESFNGTSDHLIYEKIYSTTDYVSFENFSRVSQLYVPSFLSPQKDSLLDMDEIVKELTNDPTAHGCCISFSGDLFRRFGLAGVVVGSFMTGLFLKIVEIILLRINNVLYFLYNLIFILYFPGVPFRSLLESIWIWFYEIPKYLFVFLIIYIVYCFFFKGKKPVHESIV